jgi:hypothetical protein
MSDAVAPAAPQTTPVVEETKLDDLMLAMDVVDTLRHDQRLVEKELAAGYSDEALIERLRDLYRGQGIEVSDEVLVEGVKALREKRFTYASSQPGLGRTLALMWIDRSRLGKFLLLGLLAISGAWAANYYFVTRPQQIAQMQAYEEIAETLPKALQTAYDEIAGEAKVDEAKTYAERLLADGKSALSHNDAEAARKAVGDMQSFLKELRAEFTLKIVNRPGEASGVWRKPEINPQGRNDYLIVEAVTSDGRVLPRAIRSEETGVTSTVTKWGVRVSREVYQRVLADKRQDGIISENVVGEKHRGYLDIDYKMPVLGGTITKW